MAATLNDATVSRPAATEMPANADASPEHPAAPHSRLDRARHLVFGGTLGAVSLCLSGAFPVGHARAAHDWLPGSTGCFRSPQLEQLAAMMHPHEGRFALGFAVVGALGYVVIRVIGAHVGSTVGVPPAGNGRGGA